MKVGRKIPFLGEQGNLIKKQKKNEAGGTKKILNIAAIKEMEV